jgi:hypothetical protein
MTSFLFVFFCAAVASAQPLASCRDFADSLVPPRLGGSIVDANNSYNSATWRPGVKVKGPNYQRIEWQTFFFFTNAAMSNTVSIPLRIQDNSDSLFVLVRDDFTKHCGPGKMRHDGIVQGFSWDLGDLRVSIEQAKHTELFKDLTHIIYERNQQ